MADTHTHVPEGKGARDFRGLLTARCRAPGPCSSEGPGNLIVWDVEANRWVADAEMPGNPGDWIGYR